MHCQRCLKGAELEQLEPVGPFAEQMCGECREVFRDAELQRAGVEQLEPLELLEQPRLELERAPAPVIDGAAAFGNHMVEWRD